MKHCGKFNNYLRFINAFLFILSDVYFYTISVVFCKHQTNSSAILRF
jgi:hypothetical protein